MQGEPCGECTSCQRIWAGSASLDVVEIDAASNRGVDDARELRERAMYAASQEGRHKVYIVDEAHMLTREAWNTLLKVLEEPPAGVVFVFATTEPHKITQFAAPVMSRLQRFDFRPVGPQAIAARLGDVARQEALTVDSDALELIARVANGGMRDALSVLDQVGAFGGGPVTAPRVRDVLGLVDDETYAELLGIVAGHRARDVFPFVARLVERGMDIVALAEGAGDLWRAALAMRLEAAPEGISSALAERIRNDVDALEPGDILRIMKSLAEAEELIKKGGSPRLAMETLLVRWTLMDRTVDIAELLGEGRPGEGREVRGERAKTAATAPRVPDPRAPIPDPRTPSPDPRVPQPDPRLPPDPREPSPDPRSPTPDPRTPIDPVSLAGLRSQWPVVVEAIRADRKGIVAETVADTEAVAFDDGVITLKHLGANQMTPDAVNRNKALIEAAIARVIGTSVKIQFGEAGQPARQPASPPGRLSPQAARTERTRALRGKDPALDKAMEAMDLELLD
jgi:DNA polymerase-3 subunit gamma/tau